MSGSELSSRPGDVRIAGRRVPGLVISLLVGLLSMAVMWKLRTVPVPTDPWHYVVTGLTFPDLTWNMVGLTRYGMILPMMVVTHFFGMSELSFYLPPLLATGTMVVALYWLGMRYFGHIGAAAGIVLVLSNNVVLPTTSRAYPDIFAVSMTAVAIALAVAARDRWQRTSKGGAGLWTLLVLVGVFVGLSWWMRETAVFAWPVVAVVLLWKGGPPWRLVLPLAGGAAVVLLGLEMLIGQWAFGDPMARFEALSGADLSQTTNAADIPYLNQSRLTYLMVIPKAALLASDGVWSIVLGAIAVVGLVVAPRKVGVFAGWFLLVALSFVAIGGAVRPWAPNIRLDVTRYWVAFLPPMAMAAAGTVTIGARLLAERFASRWGPARRAVVGSVLAVLLLVAPVTAAAASVRDQPTYVAVNDNTMAVFRNWLHEHDREVKRIAAERDTMRILDAYTRSLTGRKMADVRFLPLTERGLVRPGDHVVIFSEHDQACPFCNFNVNVWLDSNRDVLDRWDKVWTSPDKRFEVYEVPESAGRYRLKGFEKGEVLEPKP